MIHIFRKIRAKLLSEKKFSKYLLYAIGEIILVVIGILIALSINNWNSRRLNTQKERVLLMEIQENLNEDLQNLDSIMTFNELKIKSIDSAFYYMSQMKAQPLIAREFSNLLSVITNYESFSPVSVAFNNIISSDKIDILSSNTLRKRISRYYSNDDLEGLQGQLVVSTQNFLDEVAPKMMNKNLMKSATNLDFEVNTVEQVTVYKDPNVLSDLFVLKNKTGQLNRKLGQIRTETVALIQSLENHLEQMN